MTVFCSLNSLKTKDKPKGGFKDLWFGVYYFGSDPDHIDYDHITEKGTWKTERGCLIREWRWTYGSPEYTEKVHRDTIRYRSKLLGDYLPLKGTYLEGCERW